MRCNNCGYVNETGATHCIKCDAPLVGDDSKMGTMPSCPSTEREDFQPGATVCEVTNGGSHGIKEGVPSLSVGRQRPEPSIHDTVREDVTQPPSRPDNKDVQGTINPWICNKQQSGSCWLRRLDESSSNMVIKCEGEQFEITRENSNPDDHAISSHQAVITHDANGWYIEDISTYKTTAIIAGRKMKLEEGDVLVFGMSRFQFTEKNIDMTD